MSSHFETSYRVRAYEAGPQGHATAVTLANYLQSAASDHAQTLGFALEDLASQNLTWVLHRLRGTIHGTVGWGDDVGVTSWLAGIRKLYGLRDYRLLRPDGEVRGPHKSFLDRQVVRDEDIGVGAGVLHGLFESLDRQIFCTTTASPAPAVAATARQTTPCRVWP